MNSHGTSGNEYIEVLKENETVHPLKNRVSKNARSKPALGLRPRRFADEQRLEEIKAAMHRFMKAGQVIPEEWLIEYNELCQRRKERER